MRLLFFLTVALGAACADAPTSPTSPAAPSLPTLAGALFAAWIPAPQRTAPYRLTDFSAVTAGPSGPLTGTFQIVTLDETGRETERLRNDIVGLTRVR